MTLTHLRVLKVLKNLQMRRSRLKPVKKMMKILILKHQPDQRDLFYLRKMTRISYQRSSNFGNLLSKQGMILMIP
jgi:hypothetical protein